MRKFYCAFLAGLLVFAAACTSKSPAAQPSSAPASSQTQSIAEKKVELMVSAAASLTDCMNELKAAYIAEHSNITITYNFASSGSLQQQIEQGAPCDIFFSAGKKQMKALQDKNLLVADSVKDVLENRVVLITSKNSKKIESFKDLTNAEFKKIAVGEPKTVPVGQYTTQIFEDMKLTEALSAKLVYAKDVREVLSWVETENVQAGIVYETDAKISDKVQICVVAPADSHDKVVYPIGIIKESKQADAAKQFVHYLLSANAKKIFTKYGFSSLV